NDQGQSSVLIRIINRNKKVGKNLWKDLKLKKPGFDSSKRKMIGDNYGIGFLFYSKLPGRKDPEHLFFKPGTTFTFELKSKDEQLLREAAFSFYIASVFGGLGSRSRRTAGSFQIKDYDSNSNVIENTFDFT